jgi:hypothetical protein
MIVMPVVAMVVVAIVVVAVADGEARQLGLVRAIVVAAAR